MKLRVEDAQDADRRGRKRTRVTRDAKILVPRRSSVIFCTVEYLTSGGARLKLADTFGVPETFELTFEHGRTRRSCRVMWRTGDRVGVEFESASSSPKPVESPARA